MKPFTKEEDKFINQIVIVLLFVAFMISFLFASIIVKLEKAHKVEQVTNNCN